MNFSLTDTDKKSYFEYVEKNSRQIKAQSEIVEQILDEKFDLVYDFFCDILEREVQYKILRARRCQVLFHIFLPIILLNEENIKIQGTFISDNSMIKYKKYILNSSALIIDDILIHGRGLKYIYEMLDVNYLQDNISIFVLYKSKEANQIKKQLLDRIESKREVFDYEWMDLSCKFVNAIYASTSPYISFVSSYIKNGNNDANENILDFHVYDNTNDYQKQQGEKSYVLFEKSSVLPIFNQISYDCCLRVYENKNIEKITYIPYVFIKNFNVATNELLFRWVCERINSNKTELIQADLLNHYNSKEGIEYQAKLFAALMNQIYSLYLQKKYKNILSEANIDLIALRIIYGEQIAKELSQISYEDVEQVLLDTPPANMASITVNEDIVLKEIWDNLNKNGEMPFPLYFYLNRQIDEENAKDLAERKRGLTTGYFYNSIPIDKRHELSGIQLNCWDSGIASCSVHMAEDQTVAFYNAAGEQSFRYVLEKFSEILKEMIFLYNKPLFDNTLKSGGELVLERMDKLIDENKNNKIYTEEELHILQEFLKKNAYRLGAWILPQVFL